MFTRFCSLHFVLQVNLTAVHSFVIFIFPFTQEDFIFSEIYHETIQTETWLFVGAVFQYLKIRTSACFRTQLHKCISVRQWEVETELIEMSAEMPKYPTTKYSYVVATTE